MKKQLEKIRRLLESFHQVVAAYPESPEYKQIVFDLQQQEVDLINQIGRKVKQN